MIAFLLADGAVAVVEEVEEARDLVARLVCLPMVQMRMI